LQTNGVKYAPKPSIVNDCGWMKWEIASPSLPEGDIVARCIGSKENVELYVGWVGRWEVRRAVVAWV